MSLFVSAVAVGMVAGGALFFPVLTGAAVVGGSKQTCRVGEIRFTSSVCFLIG